MSKKVLLLFFIFLLLFGIFLCFRFVFVSESVVIDRDSVNIDEKTMLIKEDIDYMEYSEIREDGAEAVLLKEKPLGRFPVYSALYSNSKLFKHGDLGKDFISVMVQDYIDEISSDDFFLFLNSGLVSSYEKNIVDNNEVFILKNDGKIVAHTWVSRDKIILVFVEDISYDEFEKDVDFLTRYYLEFYPSSFAVNKCNEMNYEGTFCIDDEIDFEKNIFNYTLIDYDKRDWVVGKKGFSGFYFYAKSLSGKSVLYNKEFFVDGLLINESFFVTPLNIISMDSEYFNEAYFDISREIKNNVFYRDFFGTSIFWFSEIDDEIYFFEIVKRADSDYLVPEVDDDIVEYFLEKFSPVDADFIFNNV
jgi:hypothetical protein